MSSTIRELHERLFPAGSVAPRTGPGRPSPNNPAALAKLIGTDRRTAARYLDGSREPSETVMRLMLVAERFPEVRQWLMSLDDGRDA